MLLANYASDSGSDSESETPAGPASATASTSTAARSVTSLSTSAPASKLTPTPVAGPSSLTAGATKGKKRGGPVRITLDLPKAGNGSDASEEADEGRGDEVVEDDEGRNSKRIKLPKGKGGSSLLGMLPPPKRKLPTTTAISKGSSLAVNKSMAAPSPVVGKVPKPLLPSTAAAAAALGHTGVEDDDEEEGSSGKGGLLLPPSIARGKAKKAKEEELDLFGLSAPVASTSTPPIASTSTNLKPPLVTSAPDAPDFVPPAPTSSDPYPGYYQTPSGEWRAYDPEYYHSFFPSSAEEAEQVDDGRVGKHWNAYERGQFNGDILDIDANKGLEEARKEEERRAMMKSSKVKGDEYDYKPIGQVKGLAAQRHQLTSLLSTAYSQREELEDRIAQNKKSMRAAGQKYGF